MNTLELRIPPPLVALIIAILMWLSTLLVAPLAVPTSVRLIVAGVLAIAGVGCGIAGVRAFRRARTTINPTTPNAASALVIGGIYRLTRNPMYLGVLTVLLAWAAFLANGVALLLALSFVFYINRFQIAPEERALSSLFPQDYASYKNRVRRWI